MIRQKHATSAMFICQNDVVHALDAFNNNRQLGNALIEKID